MAKDDASTGKPLTGNDSLIKPAEYYEESLALARRIKAKDPRAIYELGLQLRAGNGVPRDEYTAMECFNIAAQLGYPDAKYMYAVYLAEGRFCKKDLTTAYVLAQKAVSCGVPDYGLTEIILKEMSETQKAERAGAAQAAPATSDAPGSELSKPYMIVTLYQDLKITDALVKQFSQWKNMTILNLLGPSETVARKFINSYDIDLAILDYESLDGGETSRAGAVVKNTQEGRGGANTFFLIVYTEANIRETLTLKNDLDDRELAYVTARYEPEKDYNEITERIVYLIHEKEKLALAREKSLAEWSAKLLNELRVKDPEK